MDEIKKISNNTVSPNISPNSKDNYTLLKEKYAKFLADMQKSEMNNSITRFENELAILDELLAEAEKNSDRVAIEEYTKKAEEIEKKISAMQIEVLPSMNNGLFFRPAIKIVPDVNDGSEKEKFYALSKFYTIGEDGEEVPLFSKKEIKEFLKDENLYNRVLSLTTVTREDENGCDFPILSADTIKEIANDNTKPINEIILSRMQNIADIKEYVSWKNKEEYFFQYPNSIYELAENEEIYNRTLSLTDIKQKDNSNFFNCKEINKYAKDEESFKKIMNLDKLNKTYNKGSDLLLSNDFITQILVDEEKYNEILKVTSTIKRELSYAEEVNLSRILSNDKYRKCFVEISNLQDENGNNIFSDFLPIKELLNCLMFNCQNSLDENTKDTFIKISSIKDDKGNKLYTESELVNFFYIAKKYDSEEILEVAKLTYLNEQGEKTPLLNIKDFISVPLDDTFIENAKLLTSLKYTDENGIERNTIPRNLINVLLKDTNAEYTEEDLTKIDNFLKLARSTYYTDLQNNKVRIFEEEDFIQLTNLLWEDIQKEDIELVGKLLNLTTEKDGKEVPIFQRSNLLTNYAFYFIPKHDKVSEHYLHNIKELVKLDEIYDLQEDNGIYDILDLAKNCSEKIDEKFLKNFDEMTNFELNGTKMLTPHNAARAVLNGVTKATIQELKEIKSVIFSAYTNKTTERNMFDENYLGRILEMPNQIKNIEELAKIRVDIGEEKEVNLFDATSLVQFLENNPNFEITEEFRKNIEKIKSITTKDNYNISLGYNVLTVAQDSLLTDKLINLTQKLNNDLELTLKLIRNNDSDIDENTIKRINSLCEIQVEISSSHYSREKECIPMFSKSEIIQYAKNENTYNNICAFIDLFSENINGKKVLNSNLKSFINNVVQGNLQIDEKFLKEYEEFSNIKIDDKPFLTKALIAKAIFTGILPDELKEITKYTKNTKNGKESIFSDLDLFTLMDVGIKRTTPYLEMFSKDGKCALNGNAILECVKNLPPEYIDRMKQIAEKVQPNNLRLCDAFEIRKIIENIDNDEEFNKILNSLDKYNGDLEVVTKLDFRVFLFPALEKINTLSKFYNYDEETDVYTKIISEKLISDMLEDEHIYETIIKLANYKSQNIDGYVITKFKEKDFREIIKRPDLADTIITELPKKIPAKNLEKYEGSDYINAAKFLFVYDKKNINELSLDEKRKLISTLISTNAELFQNGNFRKDFPLLPKNQQEYCEMLPKLVKSIGIETEPLDKQTIQQFLNKDLHTLTDLILDINVSNLKIEQEITPSELIQQIKTAQLAHNISDSEMNKVFDYFGFEIKNDSLEGYPANINNGVKLNEIKDENTKKFINNIIRPIITDFTKNNTITTNKDAEFTNILNQILKVMPELQTTISKESIFEEGVSVLEHSLKIIKEYSSSEEFNNLPKEDKETLVLATLLHNISSSDTDSSFKESAFDSFFICKKLNLSKKQESKLYDLINNFNWNDRINSSDNKAKTMEDIAFNLRSTNSLSLATIFEKAKIRNTTSKKAIVKKEFAKLEENEQQVKQHIKELQKTQPMLPNTTLPKASEIKEGKV